MPKSLCLLCLPLLFQSFPKSLILSSEQPVSQPSIIRMCLCLFQSLLSWIYLEIFLHHNVYCAVWPAVQFAIFCSLLSEVDCPLPPQLLSPAVSTHCSAILHFTPFSDQSSFSLLFLLDANINLLCLAESLDSPALVFPVCHLLKTSHTS